MDAQGSAGLWFWGRTLDLSRFLLPLQALRCTGSWGQPFSDPGRCGAQEWAPAEPDLPISPPGREDFPLPPWLPLLLLSTWLPLLLFFYFSSSIPATGGQGLAVCALPSGPLGLGSVPGVTPWDGHCSHRALPVLADNWTFPAVCCCCGFRFIVPRWFFAM